MESFKKAVRLLGLVVLMLLASVGIGIGGAVPVLTKGKRGEYNDVRTEVVEKRDERTSLEAKKDVKQ